MIGHDMRTLALAGLLGGNGGATVSETGRADRRVMVSGMPNLYLIDGAAPLDETITLTYGAGIEVLAVSRG